MENGKLIIHYQLSIINSRSGKDSENICGRTPGNGGIGHRKGTATAGIYEHRDTYAQGTGPDTTGPGGEVLRRGTAGICVPGRSESGRHRGQPGGAGGLHVREHDTGNERDTRGMEERLPEAGVPGIVVHLSAHGSAADEGELPADVGTGEDERGVCAGENQRAEVL